MMGQISGQKHIRIWLEFYQHHHQFSSTQWQMCMYNIAVFIRVGIATNLVMFFPMNHKFDNSLKSQRKIGQKLFWETEQHILACPLALETRLWFRFVSHFDHTIDWFVGQVSSTEKLSFKSQFLPPELKNVKDDTTTLLGYKFPLNFDWDSESPSWTKKNHVICGRANSYENGNNYILDGSTVQFQFGSSSAPTPSHRTRTWITRFSSFMSWNANLN